MKPKEFRFRNSLSYDNGAASYCLLSDSLFISSECYLFVTFIGLKVVSQTDSLPEGIALERLINTAADSRD